MNLCGQGKGREGGESWVGGEREGGESPGHSFCSVSLDPEQQAVQGVLCEGDSRQSRLLGLVRYRLEHGGQEHA